MFLYGHRECSLCDRLEAMVRPMLHEAGVALVKRDITTNRDWLRAYRYRIPVLTDENDHVILEGRPDPGDVAAAIRALLAKS